MVGRGTGRLVLEQLLTLCNQTVYVNGWSVCYVNGVGQMTLENAEFFFGFFGPSGTFTCWGCKLFDTRSVY